MSKKTVSAIMLSLLVISTLTLTLKIQIVKANDETIYIRTDGSIDPPTAPISTVDNITYTFVGGIINDSIVIERDNITVDGAGYTIQGTNATFSKGIYSDGRNNITIRNMKITTFENGIFLNSCSGCTLSGNNITANSGEGIHLVSSGDSSIRGNNITANYWDGIHLDSCGNSSVSGNNVTNNNCGIHLDISGDSSVSGNNITNNGDGIFLFQSYYNDRVSGNNIANKGAGVHLSSASDGNSVSGNNITNNGDGILLDEVFGNSVSGNSITNNGYGIFLSSSNLNTISGNNITDNEEGIYLDLFPIEEGAFISHSSDSNSDQIGNTFYHNNFVNNTSQVNSYNWTVWDDGYPSGGNYWSDYNSTDLYYGPGQNKTGGDGIRDTPYVIDSNNTDHYPFVNPLVIPSTKLVGDLNLDGKVNHSDVTLLSYSYSSKSGDPNWNPNADLAPPYGIISLTDLVTLAIHYRQHSP